MQIHYYISDQFFCIVNLPISEISRNLAQVKRRDEGNKIYEIFRLHHSLLLDAINPEEAAGYLYEVGIINDSEFELAMIHSISRSERSKQLLLSLYRKLRANPQLCGAAIVSLRKAGTNMDSISEALKQAGVNIESKSKVLVVTINNTLNLS